MTLNSSPFNLRDYFFGSERLARIKDNTAIEYCGEKITYDALSKLVHFYGGQLRERRIAQGDRVALLLYDSPIFITCFFAAASIGAICVPVNTALSPDDVNFIIRDSGARLVIYEEDLKAKLDSIPDSIEINAKDRYCLNAEINRATNQESHTVTTQESPAFMLYTSGSTGTPKGALHRHDAIPYTVESYSANVLRLTEQDRIYSSSRLFFAYGLGNSLSFPLAAGACVLLDSERPSPARIAKIFKEQKPTVFFGVPAVYGALLDFHASNPLDVSSLRLCVSAGEALPARIFEDWRRELGLTILDGIGSTEMLHIFISNSEVDARTGSSGKIVTGYEARLVDDSGNKVSTNELGNLWVKGGSATTGYWNRPELTQETVQEGWVKTGDIYRCDEEGFYYHVGRSDDCFKVRGLWVSPIEVESALLAHEAVAEAAIVSAVGRDGLATVRAFVVIRQEGDGEKIKSELRDFAGSRLAKYKVPSEIVLIDEMPRTSTGKIQRFKLRAEPQRRNE
ncbi:MAG: benzoate-CoA ligase family protein [Blastocatellia bacterium]